VPSFSLTTPLSSAPFRGQSEPSWHRARVHGSGRQLTPVQLPVETASLYVLAALSSVLFARARQPLSFTMGVLRGLVPAAGLVLPLVASHATLGALPTRNMHGDTAYDSCVDKRGSTYCDAGCNGDACLWYQVGCLVGCDECSLDGKEMWPTPASVQCARNGTAVPEGREPFPSPRTVPAEARSWNIEGSAQMGDWTAYMPWSAPGASPIVDPCGVASGFKKGSQYASPPKGYDAGDLGSIVLDKTGNATVVRAGEDLEVGFGFEVNHGGGYSYRLCKADGDLTEECFQAGALEFSGDDHLITWIDGSKDDVSIPATTISEGTTPAKSQWRRNPIPACNCDLGEGCHYDAKCDGECTDPSKCDSMCAYEQQSDAPERCPTGVQFPVPSDDLYGYGDVPSILVKDKVKIPRALAKGEYVLSWRWDCEQTPQIWNSCADLTVV